MTESVQFQRESIKVMGRELPDGTKVIELHAGPVVLRLQIAQAAAMHQEIAEALIVLGGTADATGDVVREHIGLSATVRADEAAVTMHTHLGAITLPVAIALEIAKTIPMAVRQAETELARRRRTRGKS